MKIRLLQDCGAGSKGDIVEEDQATSDILIREEIAEPAPDESLEMKAEATREAEPEERRGVNVKDLLPGGDFIAASDVLVHDAVKIMGPGYVDDSFDKDRLILPVVFENEEWRVSLGPENIERIAEVYGLNTKNWVGKPIQVADIRKYKGIKEKGIIWKPPKDEAEEGA